MRCFVTSTLASGVRITLPSDEDILLTRYSPQSPILAFHPLLSFSSIRALQLALGIKPTTSILEHSGGRIIFKITILPSHEILDANTSANSPSLDRIIPDLGYVEENVAFKSMAANTLKLNRTPFVLRRIADFVETHVAIENVE